jgi:cytochrome P450
VREEETLRMMEYIQECGSSASPMNLTELCTTITNDVVCRVAFGKKYREGRGKKLHEVLLEFEELLASICIGDYLPWLDWLAKVNGFYSRAEKCAKYLDEFLEQVIEEHITRRSDGDVSVDSENQNDFVDVLLSVQKTNAIGFPIDRTAIKALILVSNNIIYIYQHKQLRITWSY